GGEKKKGVHGKGGKGPKGGRWEGRNFRSFFSHPRAPRPSIFKPPPRPAGPFSPAICAHCLRPDPAVQAESTLPRWDHRFSADRSGQRDGPNSHKFHS